MNKNILPQNDQKIAKFSDLKVGDEVFFVPNDHRYGNGPEVKAITKVGRKYTYIGRMQITEWAHNGYAIAIHNSWPHGEIYASEQDYLEMREWNAFVSNFGKDELSREQKRALLDFYKKLGGFL